MSACCARESQPAAVSPGACPLCGSQGARVDPITLEALVVPEALRRAIPPVPRFCATRVSRRTGDIVAAEKMASF